MHKLALPILGLLLFAAGCGGSGDSGGGSSNQDRPGLRAVNAAPTEEGLDFRINGDERLATNLGYLATSPSFGLYEVADYDVGVAPTGSPEEADVIAFQPELSTDYLIAAVGLREFGTEFDKRLRVAALPVDRSQPNGSKVRLIVLNGFLGQEGAGNPTIDFQDGERPNFPITNIQFGAVRSLEVDTGTFTFQARLAGTETVYVEEPFDFVAGRVYLAIVSGQADGSGARLPNIEYVELGVRPTND